MAHGWHEERHLTVWTCKRCGGTKVDSDEMGDPHDGTRAGLSLGYEERWAHQQAADLVIAADRLDDEVYALMHQHQHPHNDPVFQVLLAHEPLSPAQLNAVTADSPV